MQEQKKGYLYMKTKLETLSVWSTFYALCLVLSVRNLSFSFYYMKKGRNFCQMVMYTCESACDLLSVKAVVSFSTLIRSHMHENLSMDG